MAVCPYCGAQLNDRMQFCTNCGKWVLAKDAETELLTPLRERGAKKVDDVEQRRRVAVIFFTISILVAVGAYMAVSSTSYRRERELRLERSRLGDEINQTAGDDVGAGGADGATTDEGAKASTAQQSMWSKELTGATEGTFVTVTSHHVRYVVDREDAQYAVADIMVDTIQMDDERSPLYATLNRRAIVDYDVKTSLTTATVQEDYDLCLNDPDFSGRLDHGQIKVERADNVLLSYVVERRTNTYASADYEQRPYYDSFNYDTGSGKEVALSDVIADKERLLSVLIETLEENDATKLEMRRSASRVTQRLSEQIEKDYLEWTFSADQMSVWLGYSDVASFREGVVIALPFDKYPELFFGNEYTARPAAKADATSHTTRAEAEEIVVDCRAYMAEKGETLLDNLFFAIADYWEIPDDDGRAYAYIGEKGSITGKNADEGALLDGLSAILRAEAGEQHPTRYEMYTKERGQAEIIVGAVDVLEENVLRLTVDGRGETLLIRRGTHPDVGAYR